jgi:vitamin B12 transporter
MARQVPPSLCYGATGWSEDAKNLLRKRKNERGRHDTDRSFSNGWKRLVMAKKNCAFFVALAASYSGILFAQTSTNPADQDLQSVVVTATRLDTPIDQSPSATTLITEEDIESSQYRFATDALRSVPGLDVVQTGTAGQLTSIFIRGNNSDQTQVLVDGIPFNQGLSGAFNFADFTTDNISRIEVVRGPQSALYGSNSSGGIINFVTRRGEDTPQVSGYFEGGSYDSFREAITGSAKYGPFDFSIGASRFDTENARPNNDYRANTVLGDAGFTPISSLRIGLLFYYDYADAGSPNTIFNPQPVDNLRTERYLLAPNIEFSPVDWWRNKVYYSFDQERQVNEPDLLDSFLGPTRGVFRRSQAEYQTDISPLSWLTITAGTYFSRIYVYQDAPQTQFPPALVSNLSQNLAGFGQLKVTPLKDLSLYAAIRYDTFLSYTSKFTYRFAANYIVAQTGTILRASYGIGFTPPAPQDIIFGGNPHLQPNRDKGFNIGAEQPLFDNHLRLGGNFFYTTNSNSVSFNELGLAVNQGSDRIQGCELYASLSPIPDLFITANWTYLDAVNTSELDTTQFPGARLIRRPRNTLFGSISYLWFGQLTTKLEVNLVNARQDANFLPTGTIGPNVNVPDYTVARFAAEWKVTSWLQLFGRIENLTNQHYQEVLGYPALSRSFYGGLKLQW